MIIDNCQLEFDERRGVLYVHAPEGFTAVRICGLPRNPPKPSPCVALDITLKFGAPVFSWGHEE